MSKEQIIELITSIVGDTHTATMIVNTLLDEGVLHIGFGNKAVDMVCEQFKHSFGTTKVSKRDRYAASRLSDKYGTQAVIGIIKILAVNSGEPYAPVVGSVQQLEDKWVQVLNFVRKSSVEKEVLDV